MLQCGYLITVKQPHLMEWNYQISEGQPHDYQVCLASGIASCRPTNVLSIETLGTLVEPSLLSNHYSWALVSV